MEPNSHYPYNGDKYQKSKSAGKMVTTGLGTATVGGIGAAVYVLIGWIRTGELSADGELILVGAGMALAAGVFAGLRNWVKKSQNPIAQFLKAILDGIAGALGIPVLVIGALVLGGCAGLTATPQPILQVGQMQAAGLLVLQRDVETSIDALVEARNNAVRDGYRLFFEAEADKMTDASGYVLRSEYDAFAADMAEDLESKVQRNEMEGAAIKARLNASFSDVRQLGQAVQDYNEAQQVTEAAWENLVSTTSEGVNTAGQIIMDWRAHNLAQSEAAKAANAQRRGSVMQFLSEVQKAVNAGQRPNVDWLREAAEALDSGGEIPVFPMVELEE